LVDLKGPVGVRPGVVVHCEEGNKTSPVTIVAAVTQTIRDKKYNWDVIVKDDSCGLNNPSRIMCNQIFTVPKQRLKKKKGELPLELMREVNQALKNSLALT